MKDVFDRKTLARRGKLAVALTATVGTLTLAQALPGTSFAAAGINGGGSPGTQYDACNVSSASSGTTETVSFELWGSSSVTNGAGSGNCLTDDKNNSSKKIVLTVNAIQDSNGNLVAAPNTVARYKGKGYEVTLNMGALPSGTYTLGTSDNGAANGGTSAQYAVSFYYTSPTG